MSIRADEPYRETLNRLNLVSDLLDDGKVEEAGRHIERVLRFAEEHGIASAHLCWALAVVLDNKGVQSGEAEHLVAALGWIRRAVEADKLALPYRKSYHVVVERARATVMDPAREPTDPAKERIYKVLLNMDEGTPEVHVAYSGYLLACERGVEAVKVLSSLTKLHPANREAWALLAEAASAIGDIALAVQAKARAEGDTSEEWTPPPGLRLLPIAQA